MNVNEALSEVKSYRECAAISMAGFLRPEVAYVLSDEVERLRAIGRDCLNIATGMRDEHLWADDAGLRLPANIAEPVERLIAETRRLCGEEE